MKQYLDIVQTVLDKGVRKTSRTGIDTLSYFGLHFRHDLAEGFPLLTTKKMDGRLWNSIVHELLWFLSGENHIRNLKKHTGIWNEWADEKGDLQTAYGFYWRNFPYVWGGKMVQWEKIGFFSKLALLCRGMFSRRFIGNFDQVAWIINEIKRNPDSRRLVCSAWEPRNASSSKLPPCHYSWIVNVQDGRLCLHWVQRSVDLFLGFPFNIASYALLCHILAKETELEPGIISCSLIDAHIYVAEKSDFTPILIDPMAGESVPRCEFDHVKCFKEQTQREPYPLPTLWINNKPMDRLTFDDFELIGYQCHPRIKARVAV